MFSSEKALVNRFVRALKSDNTPWGTVQVSREFPYNRGKTDVIAVDDRQTVIAFEAKLTAWRDALQQAYRNTCFAHASYVVLPKDTATLAGRCLAEFEKRGVGLCYIDGPDVVILHTPSPSIPIEPWLACKAVSQARK